MKTLRPRFRHRPSRVTPSHLMDRERFAGLKITGEPVADGDIAFVLNPEFEGRPERPRGELAIVEQRREA